ncbi:hypothetical protein R1flu_018843 [Riccia fluitans]|uniref:Uncharacterized protein n=1 Tax=Riccia fluitans TaxID=41844 RepID=A0ABD1ZH09_9MARC
MGSDRPAPVVGILEEGRTLCRGLAAAAPSENRRENRREIVVRASAYLELMTEASRKKEIQMRLNSRSHLCSTDDSNEEEGRESGNEELSSDEERSMNNDRNEERALEEGIGELEDEMGRLGFI